MGLIFNRRRRSRSSSRPVVSRLPIFRWFGPLLTMGGIGTMLFLLFTGRIDLTALDALGSGEASGPMATQGPTTGPGPNVQPVKLEQLGQKSNETIRIATFNIQVFGNKKSSDREVMRILAQVVAQFDVVAIQEVRGGDATAIERLIDLINASGGRFTATLSQPIGRTSQTESYAYAWDETRIQFIPGSAYVVLDTADRMHREPMVASFETRTIASDGRRPFRFTLINAHTDPDEVSNSAVNNELNVLDDVFVRVRQYDFETTGEEDCILLGDLNVDTKGLSELGQIPGIESIAGDITTNTRRTKTYDHILIDRTMTREFTGRFGVLDFQQDLGLSEQQAIMVSDHLPLWAEFSAYELPKFDGVAAGQPQVIR